MRAPEKGIFLDLRKKLYFIIFESDTPTGKAFDLVLIISILFSVIAVMLDSVGTIRALYGSELFMLEWFFTILFSIEYIMRASVVRNPLNYMKSFYGIVDFMAVVPTYFSLIIPGTQYLLVIRVLRVLRVFRVLKFMHYVGESRLLIEALKNSRRKIFVFVYTVLTLVVILGSMMYLIEGEENGFTSIPRSIYWAIVTLTTVGYGDISPQTGLGQAMAAVIMILGYGIIAVPTGIVTVEMANAKNEEVYRIVCPNCYKHGHENDAKYCKHCGAALDR